MTQSNNILSPGVLLPGINSSDPDNWRLKNYEQRESFAALRKILTEKNWHDAVICTTWAGRSRLPNWIEAEFYA